MTLVEASQIWEFRNPLLMPNQCSVCIDVSERVFWITKTELACDYVEVGAAVRRMSAKYWYLTNAKGVNLLSR